MVRTPHLKLMLAAERRWLRFGAAIPVLLTLLVRTAIAQAPNKVRATMDALALQDLFPHPVFTGVIDGSGDKPSLAFYDKLQAPGAQWTRLFVSDCNLGRESYILLTSSADGATQRLDAKNVADWRGWSAFFNGDTIEFELYVAAKDSKVFVTCPGLMAGHFAPSPVAASEPQLRSLCGLDDRDASSDSRVCRVSFQSGSTLAPGCTGWLASNGCVLTAGHCVDFDPDGSGPQIPDGTIEAVFLNGIVEFHVPLSLADGTPILAAPQNQFPVNAVSAFGYGGEDSTIGDDYSLFTIDANPTTGENAHLTKGFFRVSRETPTGVTTVRITGFGIDNTPAGTTGGENAQTLTNQTATGLYLGESPGPLFWHKYIVDTTSGNSGSPIIWDAQGVAIGIHTNSGCALFGGSNTGTSFETDALENAMNAFAGPAAVHVDAGMPALATEDGTAFRPFDRVPDGVAAVSDGGTLVIVLGNYTSLAGNVATMGADGKAFRVIAPVGTVVIGN